MRGWRGHEAGDWRQCRSVWTWPTDERFGSRSLTLREWRCIGRVRGKMYREWDLHGCCLWGRTLHPIKVLACRGIFNVRLRICENLWRMLYHTSTDAARGVHPKPPPWGPTLALRCLGHCLQHGQPCLHHGHPLPASWPALPAQWPGRECLFAASLQPLGAAAGGGPSWRSAVAGAARARASLCPSAGRQRAAEASTPTPAPHACTVPLYAPLHWPRTSRPRPSYPRTPRPLPQTLSPETHFFAQVLSVCCEYVSCE
jgi:hypothetical protein